MTEREAKAVEIIRKNYAPAYTSIDVVLERKETQMLLEAMAWQAQECAKVLEEQGYCALSPILNAGTEEATQ